MKRIKFFTQLVAVSLLCLGAAYVQASSISTSNQSLQLMYSLQVGATGGSTFGRGISTDRSGNVYVTGYTTASISGQTRQGDKDYFLAKYDSKGNLLFARQVGAGWTESNGISTDSSGNVYVTGTTDVGISGQTQQGYRDYFLAKYDSNGNLLFTRQVGDKDGHGETYGRGISTDSSGNVYVTGYTDTGISGQTQQGLEDYFLAKYDSNGNLIFTRQVGATEIGLTYGNGISTDSSGNVYVTGYTDTGISGQTQQGAYDYFLAKYDSNGNLIFTRQVGAFTPDVGAGWTESNGISTDSSGNVYVTGETNVGISGQPQPGYGHRDYFVAKYDSNGNLIFTRLLGAGGDTEGNGISTDSSGNVYVTGYTDTGMSGKKTQQGLTDYFLAKYDSNGNLLFTRQVGASGGNTYGNGISTDSSGNVYVTGETTKGISGQTQQGDKDYFLAKYGSVAKLKI